jgi:hypothetical protein
LRDAENAAFLFVIVLDIFHTPGGPEMIHAVVEL